VIELPELANLNVMANRNLKDRLPYYYAKAAVSAVAQFAAQEYLHKKIDEKTDKNNRGSQLRGAIGKAAVTGIIAGVSAGDEDTRSWDTMPSSISVGLVDLTNNSAAITLTVPTLNRTVSINPREMKKVLHIRVINDEVYVNGKKA